MKKIYLSKPFQCLNCSGCPPPGTISLGQAVYHSIKRTETGIERVYQGKTQWGGWGVGGLEKVLGQKILSVPLLFGLHTVLVGIPLHVWPLDYFAIEDQNLAGFQHF